MSRCLRPGQLRFIPGLQQLECRRLPAVTIRLDYRFDTSGFFDDPQRRQALERAAAHIGSMLNDPLQAIVPSGGNTWNASFFNPTVGTTTVIHNPVIPENELLVFVGAAPIGSVELGLASAGGFSATGTAAWLDTVRARGQAGALKTPKTDFATWGGMITFNSTSPWYFGIDHPASNQYDFTSVALHELMHIVGFGLGEPAFTRHVSGDQFHGPSVLAAVGKPVTVVGSPPDHWASGTSDQGQVSPMVPALRPGEKRSLTRLDYAALNDIGWEVYGFPPRSAETERISGAIAETPPGSPPGSAVGEFVIGVGTPSGVVSYRSTSTGELQALPATEPMSISADLRVATADVTGDGIADQILGTGPGTSSLVRIIDGQTGSEIFQIQPFESGFTGGVHVTAGDLTGDGVAELVVSPDVGGGPRIQIYQVSTRKLLADLYGINDPDFRGGVRTAVGDINGDGRLDLVVAAGAGGGPRIAIFDGPSLLSRSPVRILSDFFAFEERLRNGVVVAVADLNGDGFAELIVGAGSGGGPRIAVYSGRDLSAHRLHQVGNLFVGDSASLSGIRVAATDVDADGWPDVIIGSGPQGEGRVRVFAGRELIQGRARSILELQNDDWTESGIFVG